MHDRKLDISFKVQGAVMPISALLNLNLLNLYLSCKHNELNELEELICSDLACPPWTAGHPVASDCYWFVTQHINRQEAQLTDWDAKGCDSLLSYSDQLDSAKTAGFWKLQVSNGQLCIMCTDISDLHTPLWPTLIWFYAPMKQIIPSTWWQKLQFSFFVSIFHFLLFV